MEKEEIVLDASVVIKWFTEEVDHEKAKAFRERFLRQEIDIIVPDLILYEVGNALRYNPSFTSEDIDLALSTLYEMDITITVPSESVLSRASEIAFDYGVTFYDAFYVALASELEGTLVTADGRLFRAVKGMPEVALLSEVNSKV